MGGRGLQKGRAGSTDGKGRVYKEVGGVYRRVGRGLQRGRAGCTERWVESTVGRVESTEGGAGSTEG